MAGTDGQGTIDLLCRNHCRQLVRQGNAAKGQRARGQRQRRGGPAVGRTDGQHQRLHAVILSPAESGCELLRCGFVAAAVGQQEQWSGAPRGIVQGAEQSGLRGEAAVFAGQVAEAALYIEPEKRGGWP